MKLIISALAALFISSSAYAQSPTLEEFQALENRVEILEGLHSLEPPVVPDPEPGNGLDNTLSMVAGQWMQFGRPWVDALPGSRDECDRSFSSILGAWNGLAWYGTDLLTWGTGGHGDGCWNGILRYEMLQGQAVYELEHVPLNVPLCRVYKYVDPATGETGSDPLPGWEPFDCWFEPYVSEVPWVMPDGTEWSYDADYTKQDRMQDGVWVDRSAAADVVTRFGEFVRPRSGHLYNGQGVVNGRLCRYTMHIFGSTKTDNQVWCWDLQTGEIEQLPDAYDPDARGGKGDTIIQRPHFIFPENNPPFLIGGSKVCEILNFDTMELSCHTASFSASAGATLVWDEARQGIWMNDSVRDRLAFLYQDVDGVWQTDDNLSLEGIKAQAPVGLDGVCVVPGETGSQVVLWAGTDLVHWDPDARTIELIGGPAPEEGTSSYRIFNKWQWNDEYGVCLGARSLSEGIWAWKPDFAAATPPPPPPPGQGSLIPPLPYRTFAGNSTLPEPQTFVAWDETAVLQPEAPDTDALCPGQWAEMTYTVQEDFVDIAAQMRGVVRAGYPNIKVYVEPLIVDGEIQTYNGSIKFDDVQCGEVIGKPGPDGERPIMHGSIKSGVTGLVVRNMVSTGGLPQPVGKAAADTFSRFMIVHNSDFYGNGSLWGASSDTSLSTYIELRGCVIGPNTDWHLLYIERNVGPLVATGCTFFGSASTGHAFKNLAHYSRLEGNLFSNVGVDGQPLKYKASNGSEVVGLFPLDLYGCNDVILRNNTIVLRSSGAIKAFFGSRTRNAWGGCNRGHRLSADQWSARTLFPTADPEASNAWAEVHLALARAGTDHSTWVAEPWLTTYVADDNLLVFLRVDEGHDVSTTTMTSQRPVLNNPEELAAKPLYEAAADACKTEPDYASKRACWLLVTATPEYAVIRYVFEHTSDAAQKTIVEDGKPANTQPKQPHPDWRERAAHFIKDNKQVMCDGDGANCVIVAEPWPLRGAIPDPDKDDVVVANPIRVY